MVIPANMLMMQSMHFESFPEVSCDLNADILLFSLSLLKFKINLFSLPKIYLLAIFSIFVIAVSF